MTPIEKQIVAKLFEMLAAEGWHPIYVDDTDGEEVHDVTSFDEAILVIESVSESSVAFRKKGRLYRNVYFIVGNGGDIVSDYDCNDGDFDKILCEHGEWIDSTFGGS